MKALFYSLFFVSILVPLFAAEETPEKPQIEVCFVLDTTGSMGGLIEGAKQKIWSIANELINAKPAPDLKLGLVAYRDRGDEYVVKSHPLSDDIDAIYAGLREFRADGGGDEPESVNEALHEAVHNMPWSQERRVLKIIFLVGDAPPHMYPDGPNYADVCQVAVKKDIIINTVQCGVTSSTTPIWREIAQLAEGNYAAIGQSGNMAVIETPMDARLAELNQKFGETLVPYGSEAERREVHAKQAMAEAAPAAAAADRLRFNLATGKSVQGSSELLDQLSAGALELGEVQAAKLPEKLRTLNPDELKLRLKELQEERSQLKNEIANVTFERAEYIKNETARSAEKRDSFDETVAATIRQQAARKQISYGSDSR